MTLLKKPFFFFLLCLRQRAARCGCDKFQSWMPCWIKHTITFTMRFVLARSHTCAQLNNNVTWTVRVQCFPACDHIRGIVKAAICSRTNECAVTCGCPHPTPLLLLGRRVMDRLVMGYRRGHQLSTLSYMYLHFTALHVFVLLQQKGRHTCGFQGVVLFNVHDGAWDSELCPFTAWPGHTTNMPKCTWQCLMYS